ncbi:DNA methylase [Streptomyces sp. SID7958]|uniref:DNA methylase n=2 Tax=unclassified Streptomyces TaxID=2593676 RepID=A0A6G3R0W2_9ACTN|nr:MULTISPECIES: DNA methylase [unclassified Streptomyces]NEA89070.1 DNA methylase [Streptomyces sp. SID14436]NEC82397.1 DNA methylase [Streptomyces sp. SID7958]
MTEPTTIRRVSGTFRPLRVLDAYCCIGGATKGYQRLGWHVTGVDIQAQPDYCGDVFHQGDAVEFIRAHGHEFDFIHTSPPCQGEGAPTKGTNARRNTAIGRTYPRLITPTRAALETTGRPYVIENVAGSDVRKDLRLCGEMFGLGVLMHRYFELGGWTTPQPAHPRHRGRVRGWRHGEYHEGPYVAAYGKGGGKATTEEIRAAKGIDWSTDHFRLREALPPAYTESIGHAYLTALATALGVAA